MWDKHHTFDVAAQVLTAWPIVHFQGVVFHHCFGNGISYYTTLWLSVTANILISSERSRSFSCNQRMIHGQAKSSSKVLGYPTTQLLPSCMITCYFKSMTSCYWVIHVCVVSMGTDLRRSCRALAEESFTNMLMHFEWQWLIKNTFKDLVSQLTGWSLICREKYLVFFPQFHNKAKKLRRRESGKFGGDAWKQLHSHLTYIHHTLIVWAISKLITSWFLNTQNSLQRAHEWILLAAPRPTKHGCMTASLWKSLKPLSAVRQNTVPWR